jgi:3-oxoacyl-[acyl-carrier-protein] synthase III
MKIRITGVAHRLGSEILHPETLENYFKRDPGTVEQLSGVTRLHRMAPGEDLVGLAKEAALDALAAADVPLSKVTGIFSSCNPTTDYLIPSLAPMVASKLGLTHVLACNVGMGCAGGVQALQATFNQLVVDSQRGKISTYVLVTGDHISRMLDKESWKTAILFSDGISAVVVTNDPAATNGFVIESCASECYAGESVDVINLPNSLATRESDSPRVCTLQMRGRGVFEFGTRIVPRVKELSGVEDFSKFYIIPHQANIRMLSELVSPFGIRDEQLYTDGITKIGNISGAACFLGLEDCMKRGLDENAERVLLCAFGAELQVAVAVLSR